MAVTQQAASARDGEAKFRDRPSIMFDLTYSFRSLGARPDGILRSERRMGEALLRRSDLDVQFCRYDRGSGTFVRVARRDAAFILKFVRDARPRRPRGIAKVARDIAALLFSRREQRYRMLRWDLGRIFRHQFGFSRIGARTLAPGSILVLAGMVFDTHDSGAIATIKAATGWRVFAVCYDVLPLVHPDYFQSQDVVERFRHGTRQMLGYADRIASISLSARDDLAAFAASSGAPVPDLTTLVLGFDIPRKMPRTQPAITGDISPREYVLCVGNINIRKNHGLLYRVWRRLALESGDRLPPLVIVGRVGWLADEVVDNIRTDPAVRGRIIMIHDADDRTLAWLYANCLFSVYPSFYEGWGLPVSESLAFGRHCITSTTSSMPEAACGLAATLDPLDDDAWAGEIARLIDEPERLRANEAEIAARFRLRTWSDVGEELVAQVLTTPGRGGAAMAAADAGAMGQPDLAATGG